MAFLRFSQNILLLQIQCLITSSFSLPIKKIVRNKIDYNVTVTGTPNEKSGTWIVLAKYHHTAKRTKYDDLFIWYHVYTLMLVFFARTQHIPYVLLLFYDANCDTKWLLREKKIKETSVKPCVCDVSFRNCFSGTNVTGDAKRSRNSHILNEAQNFGAKFSPKIDI